jgi:hypothetical protein
MSHDKTINVLVSNRVTAQTNTTPATLEEGEIIFLKEDGTALAAAETIQDSAVITPVIGTAVLGEPKYGTPIQGKNVRKYTGKAYDAAVEQVSYIGENGTQGDIVVPAGELTFSMHIEFLHETGLFSERQHRRSFSKTYNATPAASDIEADFVALINADEVCKKYLTAAAMAGDNGISLTGKAIAYNRLNGYEQVSFKVSLDEGFTTATQLDEFGALAFGAAGTAASVAPTPGVGTYAVIASLEEDAVGFEGALNRIGFPADAPYKGATLGANYNVYVIEHDDVHESASLDGKIASPVMTLLAIEASAEAGSPDVLIGTILDPYMASTPGNFAAVGQ